MTLEEINELVSEIQQLLVSDSEASIEELMDLAGRHEDFVVETTKWLKAVDALLHKGLRSEAIELAERDPNLNEVVISLDFPELDAWNELLLQNEMQPTSALPEGIAAELNDAYRVSAPVEKLLQRHRTAALSRAPLSQRLQILRRLAVEDQGNPAWPKDVRDFETFRLSEIRSELDTAIKDGQLDTLCTIDNELQSDDWTLTVPVELKRRSSDAHAKLRKAVSKEEMDRLAYQLSDTFAEFNLPTAKGLFDRFNALNQIVELSPADVLMDIAGPALDWVRAEIRKEQQQQLFEKSIIAIEAGIENGASSAELERLYYEATRNDHVLPERLQWRLNDRLETLRVMAVRRRRAVIGGSIVAAVVLLAATGALIQQVRVSNSISRHKTQLAMLFEGAEATGQIQPLREYFDLLETEPSRISQSAEIVVLKQQFENLRRNEDSRKQQLELLLAQAIAASDEALTPSEFDSVFETLKLAAAKSLNDSEKTQVLKAEVAARQKQTNVQKTWDDTFHEKLRTVMSRVESLPDDNIPPYETVLGEIEELGRTPDVSAGLMESIWALQAKVQAERIEVSRTLEIARGLRGVTNAIGNGEVFLAELDKYAERHPGTGRATDFTRVAESEKALLIGALRWNKVRKSLLGIDFKRITATQAKVVVDEYSDFQKTSGPYPGVMELNDRLLILQAVLKRRPNAEGMKRIFDGKAITNAFMIEMSDGRERYYADSAPIIDNGLIFDSYTTPSGDQTVNQKLLAGQIPDAAARTRDKWLAPQSRLAQSLIVWAGQPGNEDFEGMIQIAAERVLHEEPMLDPILRMLLVERLLEYGGEGSHFINARFKQVQLAFAEAGVPRLTNWVDYSDVQNRKLRDIARAFLEKYSTEITAVVTNAVSDRTAAEQLPIGPELLWVGWLSREDKGSGNWRIRVKAGTAIDQSGEVVVLARRTPAEKPEQIRVATYSAAGGFTLDDSIETSLPVEGRPVFLVITGN